MALTATIRSIIVGLLSLIVSLPALQPIIDFLAGVGVTIDDSFLLAVSGTIATFIYGAFVYAISKVGSRWGWINGIISLGRSKTSPAYVPSAAESMTVTVTPPGEQTSAVSTDAAGNRTEEHV